MDPLRCVPYCTKSHWEPQNIEGPSIWCPQGLFSLQCICITLINVNRSYIWIVRGEQTLCLIWKCAWRWFHRSFGIQNNVNEVNTNQQMSIKWNQWDVVRNPHCVPKMHWAHNAPPAPNLPKKDLWYILKWRPPKPNLSYSLFIPSYYVIGWGNYPHFTEEKPSHLTFIVERSV